MSQFLVPRLRTPVVLVHGLFGFGRIQLAGCTVTNYFPGIAEALEEAGNRVLIPFLTPTGAIAQRAQQLKEFILQHSPYEPVHLLAHSMGGLDSRYMISRLDMAEHVLTLTTLGTPHRGSAFADWSVRRLERVLRPVLEFLGIPLEGFYDLTTTQCAIFNREVLDAPGVRYFSVAGRHDGNFLNPEWLLPYHVVARAEGENDGIVSLASAHYGSEIEVWEGDHLSLVNWLHPLGVNRGLDRDPRPRYGPIIRRLADLGY